MLLGSTDHLEPQPTFVFTISHNGVICVRWTHSQNLLVDDTHLAKDTYRGSCVQSFFALRDHLRLSERLFELSTTSMSPSTRPGPLEKSVPQKPELIP
jgi:hypothetical protein